MGARQYKNSLAHAQHLNELGTDLLHGASAASWAAGYMQLWTKAHIHEVAGHERRMTSDFSLIDTSAKRGPVVQLHRLLPLPLVSNNIANMLTTPNVSSSCQANKSTACWPLIGVFPLESCTHVRKHRKPLCCTYNVSSTPNIKPAMIPLALVSTSPSGRFTGVFHTDLLTHPVPQHWILTASQYDPSCLPLPNLSFAYTITNSES